MEEQVVGRSGKFIAVDGKTEFWWNGYNYHCVLPEELIDAMLVGYQNSEDKGECNDESEK